MTGWKLLVSLSGIAALVALGYLAEAKSSPDVDRPDRNRPDWPRTTTTPIAADSRAYETLTQAAEVYRTKLAAIANNLANAETVAFKRAWVSLESLPYRHERMPGSQDAVGQYAPTGIAIGTGVQIAGIQTDFTQGAFMQTDQELDVAIVGRGFFQVADPNGDTLYTRAGNLVKNSNGELVTASAGMGRLLQPPITIPADATEISISPEGIVNVRQSGSQQMSAVGQIELASFVNPQGLLKRGENLCAETDASGTPTLGNPGGSDGLGTLKQGVLETSNVEPEQEQLDWKRTAATLGRIHQLLQVE